MDIKNLVMAESAVAGIDGIAELLQIATVTDISDSMLSNVGSALKIMVNAINESQETD